MLIRYTDSAYLNVIWEYTVLQAKHSIHCTVFSHIARAMNNVCIFSHVRVTQDKSQFEPT